MRKIVVGVDPDSKAHGVAVYIDGVLCELSPMGLFTIYDRFIKYNECSFESDDIVFHIEDVAATSAAFTARDSKGNRNVQLKMAQHIGMCKQAQIELERLLDDHNIKVVKHKISKCWKNDKPQFEKVTGWTGRSNEDTRSAAYFGWLGSR